MDQTLYDPIRDSYIDHSTYNDPYSTPHGYSHDLDSAGCYGDHGFDRELPGAYSSGYLYDGDSYYDARDSTWDDGRFDLDDYTNYIDRELPIGDAWGPDSWDEQQYALADLLYFQQQLELDHTLDEVERLRRWEERLAWEELEDEERLRQYQLSDQYRLTRLGLSDGFWSERFGGRQVDLSHLRSVPIRRGLFSAPYRSTFVHYPNLGRRYQPYFSRSALRAYHPAPQSFDRHFPSGYPGPSLGYSPGSPSLLPGSSSSSLRIQELSNRLRAAEIRTSSPALSPFERSQALSEVQRIRQLLRDERLLSGSTYRRERPPGETFREEELRREQDEIRRDWESRIRTDRVDGDIDRPATSGLVWSRW
ncbi:hypothetical protein JCM3765_000250 [Sporobolomyces pararoseus]